MEKDEKIKIAITAGVAAVILLILVLFLAFGKTDDKSVDDTKMAENIMEYADGGAELQGNGGALLSSVQMTSDEGNSGKSDSTSMSGSSASTSESSVNSDVLQSSSSLKSSSSEATAAASSASTQKNASSSKPADGFYPKKEAVLKNVYKSMKLNINEQLKEMYTYWEDGNTAAVRDLAHLERFEAMSYTLTGSSDFYYYGERDEMGLPSGTGLAVYSSGQYYFGSWAGGVRSGEGTWFCFYPSYSDNVISEHLYSGGWANDLPDGKGQEHLDYISDRMNSRDIYLQNAIGGFSKGLYNGDMYIITVAPDNDTTEWVGKCERGSFEQIPYAAIDKNGFLPVMDERENSENHLYFSEKSNKNNGVTGIITGGKEKK